MDKSADLEDRLVDFAVRIINVVEALPRVSCYFTNHQSSIERESMQMFAAKR